MNCISERFPPVIAPALTGRAHISVQRLADGDGMWKLVQVVWILSSRRCCSCGEFTSTGVVHGPGDRRWRGDSTGEIARGLRVTPGSVRRWRRAWKQGGTAALRSKGPVSAERLSPRQRARLEAELRRGPLAHGFADDQRWTLSRIKTLIGPLFQVGYTAEGTWKLMRLDGWSCQVPVRQAMERDEAAIEVWKSEVWPEINASRATWALSTSLFEDGAGQGLSRLRE